MTIPTQRVLRLLLEDPTRDVYGVEVGDGAGLPSGTVHPIVARLEAMGWVSSQWEEVDPTVVGRPVRRYYRLTAEGVDAAQRALAGAYQAKRRRRIGRPIADQP
jgi:DNA-binding PadR family transcriptional regulator